MFPGGVMKLLAEQWFEHLTGTTELKRLRSGFLIKEILDRFKNKTLSNLTPDRTLWLYSAHDTTLAFVMNSLGVLKVFHLLIEQQISREKSNRK